MAWAGGTPALSVAVVAVILLNTGFAFIQEMQATEAQLDAVLARHGGDHLREYLSRG